MECTLRVEHPNGDTLKTIDLPEGSTVTIAGQHLPNVGRLEVVVPHDFSMTEHITTKFPAYSDANGR